MASLKLEYYVEEDGSIVWLREKGNRTILDPQFQMEIWSIVEERIIKDLMESDERVVRDAFYERHKDRIIANYMAERQQMGKEMFLPTFRLALVDTEDDIRAEEEELREKEFFEGIDHNAEQDALSALLAMEEENYAY